MIMAADATKEIQSALVRSCTRIEMPAFPDGLPNHRRLADIGRDRQYYGAFDGLDGVLIDMLRSVLLPPLSRSASSESFLIIPRKISA